MVIKKIKIILVSLLMILFLIIVNGAYLFYKFGNSLNITFENLTRETILTFYKTIPLNYKFFILSQFSLMMIVLMIVLVIKKFKSKIKLSKNDFINNKDMKFKTDLDILYEILKRKKWIAISDIEETFKVDSEVALEWSKILENGDLATIDYPRFGKSILKLLEKDKSDESSPDKNTEEQKIKGKTYALDKNTKEEISQKPKENVTLVKNNTVAKNINKKKQNKKINKIPKKTSKKRGKKISKHSKKLEKK